MIYCELCENAIEGVPASISVTCCGKCYRIEESPVERMTKSHASEKAVLQAEIDRLTAQNLQLRLICDRAMALVLTGEKPDPLKMTDEQIELLNVHLMHVDYEDLEEAESTEDMVIKMMIEPLNEIKNGSPVETNLLSLAVMEKNRKKLVEEEIQQLDYYAKMKPQETSTQMRIETAKLALDFAKRAGTIPREILIDSYSPVVAMTRESKVIRVTFDDSDED